MGRADRSGHLEWLYADGWPAGWREVASDPRLGKGLAEAGYYAQPKGGATAVRCRRWVGPAFQPLLLLSLSFFFSFSRCRLGLPSV